MVGGEKVGFYRELGEQYDVRLRLKEGSRTGPGTLPAFMWRPPTGGWSA